MDLKLIEQKQTVERYLVGRLTPPEVKFFEQLIRTTPGLAEQLGLPEALRRTMNLLDESGHEWREYQPRFWHRPWVPACLVGVALLALLFALSCWLSKRSADERYTHMADVAEQGLLLPPTRSSSVRAKLVSPIERPVTYTLGSRASPALAELRIGVGYASGNLYRLVIRRDDGTYWARLDNQLRDSNNELRLAFNSGAFAAGDYHVDVEAVNLRGDGVPFGRFDLRVEPR
jgi:hypothetical protein